MAVRLPRWNDLPNFDLYMDQVIELVNDYLFIFNLENDPNILTKSMVHNYVKLKMIPKPIKKKYNRKHLAYLIAITILKRVAAIHEIKTGIIYQADISGIKGAYELFIEEQEYALRLAASHFTGDEVELRAIHPEDQSSLVRNVTQSLAAQLIVKNLVHLIIEEKLNIKGKTMEGNHE